MEEITKEFLKYVFIESEKRDLAEKMALCISQITEAEGNLKSASTQIKWEIAKLSAELTQAAEKFRSGFEMRTIECRIDKDYRMGRVSLWRKDTGELVRERAMEPEERQKGLFEKERVLVSKQPAIVTSLTLKNIQAKIIPCLDCLKDGNPCDRSLFHVEVDGSDWICDEKATKPKVEEAGEGTGVNCGTDNPVSGDQDVDGPANSPDLKEDTNHFYTNPPSIPPEDPIDQKKEQTKPIKGKKRNRKGMEARSRRNEKLIERRA